MCITFQVSTNPVAILTEAWTAASRPFGYLRDPKPRIDSMEGVMDKLWGLKMDIDSQIQLEELAGQTQTHQVQVWLDKVTTVSAKVFKIKSDRQKCFKNWRVNRLVRKRMVDIVALLEEGGIFKNVTDKRVPPVVQEVNDAERPKNPSTERYLSQLRSYLLEDGSRIIGIWGMGGVGKTTLLQCLNNEFHSSSTSGQTPPEFKHVIWAVASKDYKLGKLQCNVAERLGLPLHEDRAKQASVIFNFLKDKSFLLLLDDLWQPLDFVEVGIPHPLRVETSFFKQKVVFTTRLEGVCGNMQARRKLKLECLNEDEAWQLFQDKVGEETLQAHARIPVLARQVAEECDGLPLALVVIGAAMSTKKTPMEWQNAKSLLEKSRLHEIHDMEKDKILPKLKFSYDNLADEVKQKCFLLCCLWPEDFLIQKTDLIECWMGHGLIDERKFDNISEAYDSGHALIGSLLAACLLKQEIYPDNQFVKMHDVVRDLALWIASHCGEKPNKFIVNSRASSFEDTQSEVERISSMEDNVIDTFGLPSNCSKLETLILKKHILFQPNLSGFFKGTPALTYLDLTRTDISDLPSEIGLLSNLRYLNLSFTKITSLPLQLGNLCKLRFLILIYTHSIIPEGLLEKLEMLSVIDLSHSQYQNWKKVFRLRGSMKGFKCLKGVGICLNMIEDLQLLNPLSNMPIWHLQFLDLIGFEGPLQLGSLNNQSSVEIIYINSCKGLKVVSIDPNSQRNCLKRLEEFTLFGLDELDEIVFRAVAPAEMMPSLTKLSIINCYKLLNISWVMCLPSLMDLFVDGCNIMKQIIIDEDHEGGTCEVDNGVSASKSGDAFPSLKIIRLYNLPSLRIFANMLLAFPSLEKLYVSGCTEMKILPFGLEIIGKNLKEINGPREWWDKLEMEEDVRTALLPRFNEHVY